MYLRTLSREEPRSGGVSQNLQTKVKQPQLIKGSFFL